jgi:hypothetical protein
MTEYEMLLVLLGALNMLWSIALAAYTLESDRRQQKLSMNKLLKDFALMVAELGRRLRERPNARIASTAE